MKYILLVLFAVASIVFAILLIRLSEVGPISTGAYRLLGAIPILLAIDKFTIKQAEYKLTAKICLVSILAGIFFAADLLFLNVSILKTTLAEASLLTNMVPFIIAPLSIVIFKQKIPLKFIITVVLAIIGLNLILGDDGITKNHVLGDWLALLSAVFYAFFLTCIKYVRSVYYTSRAMIIVCFVGGIGLFIISIYTHENIIPHTFYGIAVLFGIVVFGMIFGQTTLAYAVKFIPIQLASLFLLLSPVFGAIFALIIFGEKLTLTQIVGILIIMVAVYYGKLILERNN